nr:hypothetical protein GCM10025699_43490 [Microbacterium flavescens]
MITPSGRRRPKVPLTALLVSGLVAAGIVALPATSAVAAEGPAVVGDTSFSAGKYIVTLREPAAATYEGGTAGLPATAQPEGSRLDARAAPVQKYSDHLEQVQADVASAVGASVDAHYSVTTNAFAADLTADQARSLASDPSVAAVSKNELLKLQATPSTEFLGLGDAQGAGESGTPRRSRRRRRGRRRRHHRLGHRRGQRLVRGRPPRIGQQHRAAPRG